jgi:hypothetical protein
MRSLLLASAFVLPANVVLFLSVLAIELAEASEVPDVVDDEANCPFKLLLFFPSFLADSLTVVDSWLLLVIFGLLDELLLFIMIVVEQQSELSITDLS